MKQFRFLISLAVLGTSMLTAMVSSMDTHAATLSNRSDTLGTSAPSAAANHTIRFTPVQTIPVQGSVVITFPSDFSVPTITHEDVDVLVTNTQLPLAATPGSGSGSAHGITSTSGSGGTVTLHLNNADPITLGSAVEIRIGTHAVSQSIGAEQITNPAALGSYAIVVQTAAADNTTLDTGTISVAIAQPVGVTADVTSGTVVATPVFSPPGGTFTTQVSISISTATPGATIHYTTDGSTPTTSSAVYGGPFTLTTSATVKAIAVKPSYTQSATSEEHYTITSAPALGVVIPPPAPTTVSPAGIYGATARCTNGATIDLYFPRTAFPEGSSLSISCLSWDAFPIKTGADNVSHALGDVVFAITAQGAQQQPITTPYYPVYAILRYPRTETITATNPSQLAFFAPGQRWNTAALRPTYDNPYEFTTTLSTLGHLAVVFNQQNNTPCAERRADINCDGSVNVVDLSILMSYWHTTERTSKADINQDSRVDLLDLMILFYWWSA